MIIGKELTNEDAGHLLRLLFEPFGNVQDISISVLPAAQMAAVNTNNTRFAHVIFDPSSKNAVKKAMKASDDFYSQGKFNMLHITYINICLLLLFAFLVRSNRRGSS